MRKARSEGYHVSGLIYDMAVRLGRYDPSRPSNPAQLGLGLLLERARVEELREEMSETGEAGIPSAVILYQEELRVDGIYGTPDVINATEGSVTEYKCTWMSDKGPDDDKLWTWWMQLMSYCYMTGLTVGVLDVTYINGTYRPLSPTRTITRRAWTREALAQNWAMVRAQTRIASF